MDKPNIRISGVGAADSAGGVVRQFLRVVQLTDSEFAPLNRALLAIMAAVAVDFLIMWWAATSGYAYVVFGGLIIFLVIECLLAVALVALVWKVSARLFSHYRFFPRRQARQAKYANVIKAIG